ncbi:MAG: hypothetical protein Q9201_000914 [Fulgogasparrea decipioides]
MQYTSCSFTHGLLKLYAESLDGQPMAWETIFDNRGSSQGELKDIVGQAVATATALSLSTTDNTNVKNKSFGAHMSLGPTSSRSWLNSRMATFEAAEAAMKGTSDVPEVLARGMTYPNFRAYIPGRTADEGNDTPEFGIEEAPPVFRGVVGSVAKEVEARHPCGSDENVNANSFTPSVMELD